MEKPKTETFDMNHPNLKMQVRVTPKKMFIDEIGADGRLYIWAYVEYVLVHPHRDEYQFIISKPGLSRIGKSATIDGVIRLIEDALTVTIPSAAIDVFISRILSKVMNNNR